MYLEQREKMAFKMKKKMFDRKWNIKNSRPLLSFANYSMKITYVYFFS